METSSAVMNWLVVMEHISIAAERILGVIDYIFKFVGASSPEEITLLSTQKLVEVIASSSTSPTSCSNDVSQIPLPDLQS